LYSLLPVEEIVLYKMAQARDSAIVATLVLLCVQLVCTIVNAETYMVGGDKGWTSDVFTWPNGKSFKAGDVLGI
jgi:hypothetical protein